METETTLPITGMTCASCVNRVERALRKTPGVIEASVNLANEQASVQYDPALVQPDALRLAIEKAGYGVIEPTAGDATTPEDAEATVRARELAEKQRRLVVAVVLTLPLFLLSMARDFSLISP